MEKMKSEKKGRSKGVEEERCKKNISRWLNPRWLNPKWLNPRWPPQKISDPIFFPDPNLFSDHV